MTIIIIINNVRALYSYNIYVQCTVTDNKKILLCFVIILSH